MKRTILMIVFFVLIISIFFIPVHRIQLVDQKSGDILESYPIDNDETFTIYFTHSVELTPWYEIYYIKNNNEIYLKETIFHSYGAGLPATTIHDFSIEKDGMHITNYNKKIDTLVYRVGAVIADHAIIIRGKEIHFLDIAEPFQSILIKAEKIYLYEFLIKEVAKLGR